MLMEEEYKVKSEKVMKECRLVLPGKLKCTPKISLIIIFQSDLSHEMGMELFDIYMFEEERNSLNQND